MSFRNDLKEMGLLFVEVFRELPSAIEARLEDAVLRAHSPLIAGDPTSPCAGCSNGWTGKGRRLALQDLHRNQRKSSPSATDRRAVVTGACENRNHLL